MDLIRLRVAAAEVGDSTCILGKHCKMLTILGALNTRDMLAAMTVEIAIHCEVFVDFLERRCA